MARYIKQEMPDLQGTGETKCYYRLEKRQNLSTKEFLKKAGAHGILDDGILKHALSKIAEQLVEELADGNTVTLDGIGTFQATLGVKKDKEMDTIDGDETKRNAKSIEVKKRALCVGQGLGERREPTVQTVEGRSEASEQLALQQGATSEAGTRLSRRSCSSLHACSRLCRADRIASLFCHKGASNIRRRPFEWYWYRWARYGKGVCEENRNYVVLV